MHNNTNWKENTAREVTVEKWYQVQNNPNNEMDNSQKVFNLESDKEIILPVQLIYQHDPGMYSRNIHNIFSLISRNEYPH